MNSRLDTLQAGILLAKLKAFQEFELEDINKVAQLYTEQLKETELTLPLSDDSYYSSWAQYTVQLPLNVDRTTIQASLRAVGIPTNIYYIKPMHKQGAFNNTRSAIADCPVTEELCERVLCLPIHPYLTEDEVVLVTTKLKELI